ncbi:MAG: hypothetical protein JNK45_05480 [Myxococcales bacterium]|nr:hypothetical protein [Myxococcales bacterium]
MLRRPTALLAALLLTMSCKPGGAPVAPDGGGAATDGAGVGGGDLMAPLAPITRAAELLPANTMMLMDVAGPTRIAEILGRDALVQQFPKEYGEIVREMTKETGVDLLDPKELTGIGVDVKGRMGVAVIGVQPFTVGLYWSLSDAGRFRQFAVEMLRRQQKEIISVPMSGAELLRLDGMRAALILRGPLAMVVVRDGPEAKDDLALKIATSDPNLSLANDRAFRKATGALAPADWTTYLDAGAMWSRVRSAEEEKPESGNWAREELKTAKANGATPERIAELEQQAKDIDASEKQWADRRKAERDLVEKIVGESGHMVWTVSSKPGGLVGEGQLELGADGMVMKVLRNHPGTPALPKALSGRPIAMFTGATDVPELIALTDLFLRTEGTSWAELGAEVKKDFELDVDADLKPLLTGTGGAAVTLDGKLTTLGPDLAKQIGMAIDVELADAAKATALLDRVGKRMVAEIRRRKSTDVAVKRDAKSGAWIVSVAKWRNVYVQVAGHHLVVSTDPALAKRITSGAAGDAAGQTPSAALAAASLPDAAFGGLLDMELLMLVTMGRSSFDGPFSAMAEDSESAKVPKSKAYKAKQRELDRARADLKKARDAQAEKEATAMASAFSPWGAIGGNVTEQAQGLLARGGLFVRSKGGIAGALLESLTAVKAMEERRSSDAFMAELDRVQRLETELANIRAADVAAWRAKHGGPKVEPIVPSPGG